MTTESDTKPFILTIRLIRSFEHRNSKNLVVKVPDLDISVKQLKTIISEGKEFFFSKRSRNQLLS